MPIRGTGATATFASFADSSSRGRARVTAAPPAPEEAVGRDDLVKCPELLVTGAALEHKTALRILHKKGKRFESPWEPFFVGVYAHTLFYYDKLGDLPRGVVPLAGSDVKAVDRIFKNSEVAASSRGMAPIGEACGPCWKLTSSCGRVLLFRSPTHESRLDWIEQLRQAASAAVADSWQGAPHSRTSTVNGTSGGGTIDGKAALALARRLSRSSSISSAAASSPMGFTSPREVPQHQQSRRRKRTVDVDPEVSEMLRDAMLLVQRQKQEIAALKKRLETFEAAEEDEEVEMAPTGSPIVVSKVISTCSIPESVAVDDDDKETEEEDEVGGETEQESAQEDVEVVLVTQAAVEQQRARTQEQSNAYSVVEAPAVQQPVAPTISPTFRRTTTPVSCFDAAENESIQQQAAKLAEMARNLNKEDHTDSSSTRASSDDGSLTSSFKGVHNAPGLFEAGAGNNFLQQQASEIAEIARNLQSSFRADSQMTQTAPKSLENASSSSSSTLANGSSSSFSDCTDYQINSNESNDSIFSITQDDLFVDDDDGEIERLSEFDASDSHFLEASGFLDSIHQVMKDFIVTSQPELPRQSPDQVVISDAIIAEIRQGIDSDQPKSMNDASSSCSSDEGGRSPRIRSFFPHAKSARDFLNGDFELSVGTSPPPSAPKDLAALVVEDTMAVVASILQTAGRDEKMLLLSPFLRVFGSRNRLSHLIRWAIEIEVASVINVATLFRSDDYASRLVSTYSKAIGSKFIRVALSEPIHQIFKLKIADMELNPHKDDALRDEAQADANAENLMRACQHIIDSILKNAHCVRIPSSYFHICSHLNSKVISRFDGSKEGVEAEDASTLTRSVIGGFLFLRFVCPAITTPHLYGLTKQLPPPETRRVLVLVTKLLFKTATGVKFGEREPQFQVLNPFIEKNSPAIQQLFANLAMSPSQDIDECFSSDSRKVYSHVSASQLEEDVAVIRSIAEKNLVEIEKKLEACGCASRVSQNFKLAVLTGTEKNSLSKKFSANMKFLSGFGKKPRKQSDV
ncbi:hypothetical protein BBJ28_00000188 [Nothophytophthora sp. Chile5]|nr:hypothetical protein BBJ28_00000188 [Nothophytophthora sp. Chile5]